jgi:predicted nucleic acid-binding protein
MSRKTLLDTSVLIAFYNKGLFEGRLLSLVQTSQIFISAVTANEFVRGAHDPVSFEIAQSFVELMRGQIVTPTEAHWLECAHVSERLLRAKKRSQQDVLLLQNDILIALGARDLGATLVTQDSDFKILKDLIKMSLNSW